MSQLTSKEPKPHSRWVRMSHWIVTVSFLALALTGIEMIMVHPRFYWGEAGNDLTPALFEVPLGRNYQHGGYTALVPFNDQPGAPASASRTYDIFNQNGWGRSLHFLSGWTLTITGLIYLVAGMVSGHFRRNVLPRRTEMTRGNFWSDVRAHLKMEIPDAMGGPHYGLLQKSTYAVVIFVLLPVIALSGMTMSPAITAAYPFLLKIFFGAQSARTIHFFCSAALELFLLVHIVMIIKSGWKVQIKAMTFGK